MGELPHTDTTRHLQTSTRDSANKSFNDPEMVYMDLEIYVY